MANHPPWLRFQAFVVGLPKTGSTSLATVFGNYRSAHEWDLMDLVASGLARQSGNLSDGEFWEATQGRLHPPRIEMDSATSHHLYADLLADRFPQAVFVHSVRDVGSWVSSLLDMVLRKRLARRLLDIPYSSWESQYLGLVTEGHYDMDPASVEPDQASMAPLMRYWAAHMTQMPKVLPPERSLVVRTRDIASRLDDLAALAGVPASSLRADLVHVNRAPVTFDRFAAFGGDDVHETYVEHCAEIMAEVFPEEHASWPRTRTSATTTDWDEYVAATMDWVAQAVRESGQAAAR